jgi:hypothetical protein
VTAGSSVKHILNDQSEGIDFGRYSAYLETIGHLIPAHVHAFASDPGHFDLTSRSSLHDAWLEEVSVREVATGERNEVRKAQIRMRLLGPHHDRHIHLLYESVTTYRFDLPSGGNAPRYEHTAHGDLYTHEICLADNGLLTHEILFERNSTFFVECADIKHWETPIDIP